MLNLQIISKSQPGSSDINPETFSQQSSNKSTISSTPLPSKLYVNRFRNFEYQVLSNALNGKFNSREWKKLNAKRHNLFFYGGMKINTLIVERSIKTDRHLYDDPAPPISPLTGKHLYDEPESPLHASSISPLTGKYLYDEPITAACD